MMGLRCVSNAAVGWSVGRPGAIHDLFVRGLPTPARKNRTQFLSRAAVHPQAVAQKPCEPTARSESVPACCHAVVVTLPAP
jgi:hypothetical protein